MVLVGAARAPRSRDGCKRLNRINVGIHVSLDIVVEMVSFEEDAEAEAEVGKKEGAAIFRSKLL